MYLILSLIVGVVWIRIESPDVKILFPASHLSGCVVNHVFTVLLTSSLSFLRSNLADLSLIQRFLEALGVVNLHLAMHALSEPISCD